MPSYEYSGRDRGGALVSGALEAISADEAATQLFEDNVTPINIKEVSKVVSRRSNSSSRAKDTKNLTANQRIVKFFLRDKVEIEELIMFSRQMQSLTKAGLPLDRALKGLQTSLKNPYFSRILEDVLEGLESGTSFAGSLGRHQSVFSQLFLSLVHVGENTGRLDLAFKEINKYLELEKATRKQVKSATRYPLFVLVAIAAALAVITVFVIPVFAETFGRLGAELPWQTKVLISTSNFVINFWPLLLLVVFGSYFGFLSYIGSENGRVQWDMRKMRIPLAGEVFEKVALARFSRTFSMVLGAGLPIVQGLTVVAGAVGNAFIARNIHKMREGVERGESLHRTATVSGMFSPLVLQMISVGEETGTVDELLGEVADFYSTEVEYDIRRLSDAIEPILIIFIAGLVLILALGVFLPIWDLNTAVQN